ncbi:MAG: PhzF family phenazine biosynthesis protein [Candidatus Krumholzibacteria bacterium]|nr:PhzF family phenazine biosynthesis protein [Candidatus Krumholzibacteria bacterium]MDH4336830.1 PhzF family phenazine biosynthesis protein [Candidatus Krumholzibacteria bacterium]MDH5269161.1 PhzF family phenazine biosynthesis protein [Candidatus Krumholzibacteria bacterium]
MRYAFWTVDVFTDRAFGGNPLAVFPYATGLSTEQMQRIAREFNLSETAFVLPPETPQQNFRVRIFTPARELPFAGHPTVGTAYVLAACGRVTLEGERTRIVLGEDVGDIQVDIDARKGIPHYARLTVAQLPEWGPEAPAIEDLAAMLSISPQDLLDDETDHPQTISCGVPFLFVPLASREAVSRVRLDWEWSNQYLRTGWAKLVYAFSHDAESPGCSVHARALTRAAGIEEDPATGAACSALAGYLARREGLKDGVARWRVEQGIEMGRPSFLDVEAEARDGALTGVRVGGQSVIVSEGHLIVS